MTHLIQATTDVVVRPHLAEQRDDADERARSTDPRVRSDAWRDRWLARFGDGTRQQYARAYDELSAYGLLIDRAPLELDRFDIDAWDTALRTVGSLISRTPTPLGNASRARLLASVSSYFEHCLTWSLRDGAPWLDRNPVPKGSKSRPKAPMSSPHPYLNEAEVLRFTLAADASSPRDAGLLALLTQALRISEAVSVRIEDLHHSDGHNIARVTRKGDKVQDIALPAPAWRRIQAAVGDRETGPVLATRTGRPWDRSDAWAAIQRIAVGLGYDLARTKISPHTFRHAAITLALQKGVPLHVVQEWAGHADPRVTERYNRMKEQLDNSPGYVLAGFYFQEAA